MVYGVPGIVRVHAAPPRARVRARGTVWCSRARRNVCPTWRRSWSRRPHLSCSTHERTSAKRLKLRGWLRGSKTITVYTGTVRLPNAMMQRAVYTGTGTLRDLDQYGTSLRKPEIASMSP